MFQAMRRITASLADGYVGEGAVERAIRQSFLGIIAFYNIHNCSTYLLLLHLICVSLYCFPIYCGNLTADDAINTCLAVSADMAHGVHPNFADKHEEHHRPELHKGLVIKHNANQRYATSGVTAFLFKEVAKLLNLPTQVKFHAFCSLNR